MRKDLNHPDRYYDIKRMMLKEWRRDSKNEEKITKSQLYDTLFELVDIWTPDIDRDQYCVFFELLKMKIMMMNEEIANDPKK